MENTDTRIAKRRAERLRRKKQKKRRNILIASFAVIAIVIIAVSLFAWNLSVGEKDNALIGTWVYDEHTNYEFNSDNTGCMSIENNKFDYTYVIDKNTLKIDFKSESIHDAAYTFEIKDEQLTLIGGEGTTGGIYVLNKG